MADPGARHVAVLITESDYFPMVERGMALGDTARRMGYEPVAFTDHLYPAMRSDRVRASLPHLVHLPGRLPMVDELAAGITGFEHANGKIAGIVAFRDSATPVAVETAIRLGLPHLSPAAMSATSNKARARWAETRAGLMTPRWELLSPWANPAVVAGRVGYPVVLKPVAGTSSVHTYHVADAAQLREAFADVRRQPSEGLGVVTGDGINDPAAGFLVEEYVEGREFSVEAIVRDWQVTTVLVSERIAVGDSDLTPPLGVWPPFDPDPTERLGEAVGRVAEALGIDRGLVNGDWRVRGGDVYDIDINAGRYNGWDGDTMAWYATGTDLRAEAIALAVGDGPVPRSPSPVPDLGDRRIARIPLGLDVPPGQEAKAAEVARQLEALPHVLEVAVWDRHRPGHPTPWLDAPKTLRRAIVSLPRSESGTPEAILAVRAELIRTAEAALGTGAAEPSPSRTAGQSRAIAEPGAAEPGAAGAGAVRPRSPGRRDGGRGGSGRPPG